MDVSCQRNVQFNSIQFNLFIINWKKNTKLIQICFSKLYAYWECGECKAIRHMLEKETQVNKQTKIVE